MTIREKIENYWYYYKWHTLFALFVAILVGMWINGTLKQKEDTFNAAFINSIVTAEEDLDLYIEGFYEHKNINSEIIIEDELIVDLDNIKELTTAENLQVIITRMTCGELDLIEADERTFKYYAELETIADLRDVFDSEQLQELNNYIYYVDEIPVGLTLENASPEFKKNFLFLESNPVIGIADMSENKEIVAEFLIYIFETEI